MVGVSEWIRRQTVEAWITLALVGGSVLFVISQLEPGLLLTDTTPAGGDMGAHVWAPAFLRDELLPRFRLSGWAPDWYAGFPAYHFYMVVPSLLIVLVDVVLFLPYNVAFKLVAVSGLVALPIAGWAMGRLARLPFPMPAALAVATVPFVFDRSFTIWGGNAASTMAGEFSFTISLVFALLFLGVVLRGLETGRWRALAAVLFGVTVLCHVIPTVFAVVGAIVALVVKSDWPPLLARAGGVVVAVAALLGLVDPRLGIAVVALAVVVSGVWLRTQADPSERAAYLVGTRARTWWVVSVGACGALIAGFWAVPFLWRRNYMTNMGWERTTSFWQGLFPGPVGERLSRGGADQLLNGDLTWVITLAVVGAGTSLIFRRSFGTFVVVLAGTLAYAFRVVPEGQLWNARLLPFWYLCLYVLAAIAVVEVVVAIASLVSTEDGPRRRFVLLAGPALATLVTLGVVALPLRALPFGSTSDDGVEYSWLGISTKDRSFLPSWINWNFSGYERKAAYPEHRALLDVMEEVGNANGCGRAMWEYEGQLDRFGTPMALMLLPYWTDGCIGSMEGLYFESSATTPYHFLNAAEVSAAPSNPHRDLPYGQLDIGLGVDHLQLLGVRYYLAFSQTAIAQAEAEKDLVLVGSSAQWRIYEIQNAPLVQSLSNEPVVVRNASSTIDGWRDLSVDWYLDRSQWDVMLAAGGPSSWARILEGETPPTKPSSRATTVSDIETDEDTISFRVDRPGTPVLVKASYFPNWTAKGAEGPFRVAPNLMVVVPTADVVTLEYGRTPVDWFAILLTVAGIAGTFLARRRRLVYPARPVRERPPLEETPVAEEVSLVGADAGAPAGASSPLGPY